MYDDRILEAAALVIIEEAISMWLYGEIDEDRLRQFGESEFGGA